MPDGYETVVGLEVHCELATATKLFCSCANAFGSEPNTNICPVCLGLPGSLPVLNRRAVEFAMRIGEALHCEIRPSIFHRKNYFYPDMPKDYQISQYDAPINVDGFLDLPDGSRVGIERAHMEEDTGKTTHMGGSGGRIHGADYSLVDYNRAGVPLVEIVSRPDIRSASQARAYVAELRSILVATGASDGRMEEGSLRVDANISVRPLGSDEYGTRCEVKNMNSLRSLVRAIDYEAERQVAVVSSGGRVVQETRHFDENAGRTHSLRSKEEAYDYRYFPEPDLVPVVPDAALLTAARAGVATMPAERRRRLVELVGSEGTGEQIQTVIELDLDGLVLAAVEAGAEARLALARTANEAAAKADGASGLDPAKFAELLSLESSGQLSATQAKTVLSELIDSGGDPSAIARRLGFEAMETSELDGIVDSV
ncbi:MAG TPA: Asp-tRNA(Asn)/Glu-tRNA(Gln) amidotransferase subunit GatB, partial [Acidimicrobiales bacterium]|nr:Asp-tRNA(Asn)/Glu-tRNA(Gln) amidotransferase subunit GatB [Acidimicrobiales bacterium]